MCHRVVGAEALVDLKKFACVEMQIALQTEGHLVVIAVDRLEIFADFEEHLVALRGVADIVFDAELGKIGIGAIALIPQHGYLMDTTANLILLLGIEADHLVDCLKLYGTTHVCLCRRHSK